MSLFTTILGFIGFLVTLTILLSSIWISYIYLKIKIKDKIEKWKIK